MKRPKRARWFHARREIFARFRELDAAYVAAKGIADQAQRDAVALDAIATQLLADVPRKPSTRDLFQFRDDVEHLIRNTGRNLNPPVPAS